MRRLAVAARRGRSQEGFTLVELLAVMVILAIVLTALTTVFISGSNAELRLNKRFQAQQSARVALDGIRRELHCAKSLTLASAASVTFTLASGCPGNATGADVNVTYTTQTVASSRYQLKRGTVMVADYLTTGNVFSLPTSATPSLKRLHVDFPVNVDPKEGWKTWRLVDDIVLRNTIRS
jgi:prepilin-type N-terminal cleavage/methylation domain-containing protein